MTLRWNLPEQHIWKLVCGLPHERAREKGLLMLRVYIDDSGKADQSPVQVLAGYLATAEKWAAFSNEWQQILDHYGVDCLHMAQAWRLSKDYFGPRRGLTRDAMLVSLLECIKRHVEYAFVSSIPYESYNHWMCPEELRHLRSLRPYYFGFYSVLSQVYGLAAKIGVSSRIEVIFDEQGGESQAFILSAMDAFREMHLVEFGNLIIPTPTFQDDKDVLPLQAADCLAWLVRRDAYDAVKRNDRSKSASNLMLGEALSMPHFIKIWDDASLEKAARLLSQAYEKGLRGVPPSLLSA